jgi:benzoate-CoA ligase
MSTHPEPETAELSIPSQFNIASALLERRLAGGGGQRIAIEYGDAPWRYAEIAALVNRAGRALLAAGVAREQRVLIALPDSPEFVAAFLGAIKIGAVAVPCNTFLGAAEYAYFLRESRAPVVVTTRDLYARMEASLTNRQTVVIVDRDAHDGRLLAWKPWVDSGAPELAAADTSRDEAAFWLWTSGSTGTPKAAVHLHQHPLWCCRQYAEGVIGLHAADRTFSAAKLFHAYGLGNSLFFPFWTGAATVLFPGRSLAEDVYRIIHAHRPTVFFGVPTLFAALLQVPDVEQRFDLSSLRFCVSAGEPLPGELYDRWHERFGLEIVDGLGSTELLHMYISSRPGRIKAGSSGYPVPGYEVKILNERDEPLGANQVGDLYVKGPSAAIGYWNRRDQTKQKMRGEWFASGDKYSVDDDGYYWYAGRTDDMFKVGGEWVSPIEIESVLIRHQAVLECAVVGWEATPGVVKPKAFVVLRDGHDGSDELVNDLQAFVRDRAAHYKCPRGIEFLPELPKTATGKIQRFRLR